MQNVYHYLKNTLVPEMTSKAVPKLNESAIRRLAEKGQVTLFFGERLNIKFSLVESDVESPFEALTAEQEKLIKKY